MDGRDRKEYRLGNIPKEGSGYSFDEYVRNLPDNFAGVLRQYQSAMLDLGHLVCVTAAQEKVFRDTVFSKTAEFTTLMRDWIEFYGLTDDDVLSFLIGED